MPYKDRHGRTCGFVDFEETEDSGRFRRRYFIISPNDGAFYCYMDNPTLDKIVHIFGTNLPEGTTPKSDIKLNNISNARDATKQRPKIEFCFVVTTPDRSFYFQADNQADLEEWVRSLNGASRIMVKIPDKKSALTTEEANKSQNGSGGEGEKSNTISYKTEIVGGVVIRTPVEREGQTTLPKKPQLRCSPPTNTGSSGTLTSSNNEDSSDSEDESGQNRSRSWPRSPSPTPPINRVPSFTHPNAIMSGFCVKQGGVRKNWKRRFFVLTEEGISYYRSETDKLPIRTIYKKDITFSKVSDIPLSMQRDNLFEVGTGARTFYIQADSPEEMGEWVTKIKTLLAGQRSSCPDRTETSSLAKRAGSLQQSDEGKNGGSRESRRKADQMRRASNPARTSASKLKPSIQDVTVTHWQQEDSITSKENDKGEVKGHKGQRKQPMTTTL